MNMDGLRGAFGADAVDHRVAADEEAVLFADMSAHVVQLGAFHMQQSAASGAFQVKMMVAVHAGGVLVDKRILIRGLKAADNSVREQGGNLPVDGALARLLVPGGEGIDDLLHIAVNEGTGDPQPLPGI